MGTLDRAFKAARAKPPRVVMPEIDEERTRAAQAQQRALKTVADHEHEHAQKQGPRAAENL